MRQVNDEAETRAPFGSVVADHMAIAWSSSGQFGPWEVEKVAPLELHPASHALHYGSSCFEGLKAHRGDDGEVRLFRAPMHVERLRASARVLCLPVPGTDMVLNMLRAVVRANLAQVPSAPGAMYLRPVLLGADVNIGAAGMPSADALMYVLASPVGDYFDSSRAVVVEIETELPRSTPQFGRVKTGANYAMALGITMQARRHGADQVLFAPGGDVQETGASNFILVDDERLVTKPLEGSFLAGVTRDSLLVLAAHLGYKIEERNIHVDEVIEWAAHGEAALVGTAAVLAGVGTFTYRGRRTTVGSGTTGPNTLRLREALHAVQQGRAPDLWGWTQRIAP